MKSNEKLAKSRLTLKMVHHNKVMACDPDCLFRNTAAVTVGAIFHLHHYPIPRDLRDGQDHDVYG